MRKVCRISLLIMYFQPCSDELNLGAENDKRNDQPLFSAGHFTLCPRNREKQEEKKGEPYEFQEAKRREVQLA